MKPQITTQQNQRLEIAISVPRAPANEKYPKINDLAQRRFIGEGRFDSQISKG